jgi:hypothetical protein
MSWRTIQNENCALLGYYATSSVIPYRHIRTTYQSHFLGQESKRDGKPSKQFV